MASTPEAASWVRRIMKTPVNLLSKYEAKFNDELPVATIAR
jgi:hypothetical protein